MSFVRLRDRDGDRRGFFRPGCPNVSKRIDASNGFFTGADASSTLSICASDRSDMHSFRTDSQFFRDALERIGKADDARPARSPIVVGAERRETEQTGGTGLPLEQRELESTRVIGRLVALNGTQGVISCPLKLDEEQWSVGHLITIVHRASRLVGTVCEIATDDGRWSEDEANAARVTIELNGEIIDDPNGAPFFHRGVQQVLWRAVCFTRWREPIMCCERIEAS